MIHELRFLLRSLAFSFTEEEDRFLIQIPEEKRIHFQGNATLSLPASDLTRDHFGLQTLFSLWSETNRCKSVVLSSPGPLTFTYKVTLRNHFLYETLLSFGYNPSTEEAFVLPTEDVQRELQEEGMANARPVSSLLLCRQAEEAVLVLLRKEVNRLAHEQWEEWKPLLMREMERIHEYYRLVKEEHLHSMTDQSYADYEVMMSEKDRLLQAQIDKYRYHPDSVDILPILCILR